MKTSQDLRIRKYNWSYYTSIKAKKMAFQTRLGSKSSKEMMKAYLHTMSHSYIVIMLLQEYYYTTICYFDPTLLLEKPSLKIFCPVPNYYMLSSC